VTIEKKFELLEVFRSQVQLISEVPLMPEEVLAWRPFDGAWSVHEHIAHLFEAEIASFHRWRKAIAEPGGKVEDWNEEAWTRELNYHTIPLGTCIRVMTSLRELGFSELQSIIDRDWDAYWFLHSKQGKISLEEWLIHYIEHMVTHRGYIDRNLQL